MSRPGQNTADGDAKVLAGVCCFQCLPMEEVAGCQGFSLLVEHDADDVAFAGVKFHLPFVSPFLEKVKMFLMLGLVLNCWSLILLCKESGTRALNCIR